MKKWSPKELAQEAREALARDTETPRDHFSRLIREGFIDARGKVTVLLGGDAKPEPQENGGPALSGPTIANGERR